MAIPYIITMTQDRPADVSQRKWREFQREGLKEQALLWHETMLPEHFKPDARTRYRHQPRTPKYLARKKALAERFVVRLRGEVDNVFRGLLKRRLEAAGTVRSFPTRATLTMRGPRYITMRVFRSNQPHKAREITTVTDIEEQKMSQRLNDDITTRLNQYRQPKTVRM